MHYYKRNIGDYAKKAGRLSMLQHGSYTLLLDACYDREEFPTMEQAIEWTWASTTEEVEAVTFVLRKFFTLENGVYVQKRIQEELADYQAKSETNRRIAIEREAIRKEKSTNRARIVNAASKSGDGSPPNQEPITNNQEPINTTPSGFALFWKAYPKHQAKIAAIKAFSNQKINGELPAIISDIESKKLSDSWRKDGGKYIPNPATYLNQRRWEDESAPSETVNPFAGAI